MAVNGHVLHPSNGTQKIVIPLLINGQDVTTETTFPVISPVTNKEIWTSSSASVKSANAAADVANQAFPAWSSTKPSYRRDILLKAASIIDARAAELAGYMDTETGSLPSFSSGFIVPSAAEFLRDIAGRIAAAVVGSVPTCAGEDRNAIILQEPYGVILGIAPWNAPYILGFRAAVYAIAAGNTCVLKGSELSPRCYWAIGSVLKEAGLPDGVLNMILHRREDAAEVTQALIKHPAVKKINFTGSTFTGKIIAEQAGRVLKPCLMELGGKASSLVLADADIPKAAESIAAGAFAHSGQICMSTERVIVASAVAEDFAKALQEAIPKVWPENEGNKILINNTAVQKNKQLVRDAVDKGATTLYGDLDQLEQDSETRMRPIVIRNVKKDMNLFYTESFGPSVSLFEVDSEEEAIELANDTEYGLSASIYTKDLGKALRIAKKIESGAVHINSMTVHDEVNLPHGGTKMSGWGRFNGNAGLEEFLRTKTVTWVD